jgi:hypothetical protein
VDEVLQKVLVSIATGLTLALLSLSFESVRNALLYYRVEYDLEYDKDSGPCEWDINWEDYRLTISVKDVSNDRLEEVTFRRNKKHNQDFKEVFPSDKFQSLFDKEIYMKVNSIIRRSQTQGDKYIAKYFIRLVLRRRRW